MLTAPTLHTRTSRAALEPISNIHMMEDHDDAYDVWKEGGIQNRILVHFDGHLDFYWIADQSPQELLNARSSEELDQLLSRVTEWNLENTPFRELVHLGNFVYPAIKEGMVREFYWIIPDPFWATERARQAVRKGLTQMVRKRQFDAGSMEVSKECITLKLLGCPLTVCTMENMPHFSEPLLLDIDVDYLLTWNPEGSPPYFERKPQDPWLWPTQFLERLKRRNLPTDLVTIAYSVNEGYTSMKYKYFGGLLRDALVEPSVPIADQIPPGTAAEAYVKATEALDQGDLSAARVWWRKMVGQDASYRTVYAIPGWREEKSGRWQEALHLYDQMLQIDPEWHIPHLGRGRALWHFRRWTQAEEAFQSACRFSSGPTSAFHWSGLSAFRRGDWEEAYRNWMTSVSQEPKEVRSWYALARLEKRRGNPLKAIAYADECLKRGLSHFAVHGILAWGAWQSGQRGMFRREFRLWARRLLQFLLVKSVGWWRRIKMRTRYVQGIPEANPQARTSMV